MSQSRNTGSLTRTGYTFNGWNTHAGGDGTSYIADQNFTIDGNTTLYAQWEEEVVVPILPFITFNDSPLYIHPTDNSSSSAWDSSCYYVEGDPEFGGGGFVCPYNDPIGASSLNDGNANTHIIANYDWSNYGDVDHHPSASGAATLCIDLVYGGYDDWYLPAGNQLVAIFEEFYSDTINKGDYTNEWVDMVELNPYDQTLGYWTSTENDVYYAYLVSDGHESDPDVGMPMAQTPGLTSLNKYFLGDKYVRCVRSD